VDGQGTKAAAEEERHDARKREKGKCPGYDTSDGVSDVTVVLVSLFFFADTNYQVVM